MRRSAYIKISAGAFHPVTGARVFFTGMQSGTITYGTRGNSADDADDRALLQLPASDGWRRHRPNAIAGVSGRYFTNAINTRTQGADFVANYGLQVGAVSFLRFTGAHNVTENRVTYVQPTPDALKAQGEWSVPMIVLR